VKTHHLWWWIADFNRFCDTEANLLMKKPLATHPERSRRVIAGKMPMLPLAPLDSALGAVCPDLGISSFAGVDFVY